jgi:hypothetical protein
MQGCTYYKYYLNIYIFLKLKFIHTKDKKKIINESKTNLS